MACADKLHFFENRLQNITLWPCTKWR